MDLVIAVSEVAANTVEHARTAGTLVLWHDADEIICQVTDAGFISNPLAGSHAPHPGATAGYGLWLVNQVCDKVDLHSAESGTIIRMHMNLTVLDGAACPARPMTASGIPRPGMGRSAVRQ